MDNKRILILKDLDNYIACLERMREEAMEAKQAVMLNKPASAHLKMCAISSAILPFKALQLTENASAV